MLHPIKYLTVLTFTLLFSLNLTMTSLAAPPLQTKQKLFRYMTEGEIYGYVDISGTIVITPQFDFAAEFVDGLALVSQEKQYGYINETGTWVIEPQFRDAHPFSEGLALVDTMVGNSYKSAYAYIDKTGKVVIPSGEFEYGSSFKEGLAAISLRNKYNNGFINPTGKIVIKTQYDSVQDFSEGLAAVMVEQKWGYIDKTGKMVIQPQFEYGSSFSEGLAQVTLKEKTGFIDKTGNMIIAPQFDAVGDFQEGLAFVNINNKIGYINKTGKIVIAPQFDYGVSFANGLALIEISGKYGYIDKTGQIVIKPQFVQANPFHNGFALVWIDDVSQGYIDTKGNILFRMPLPLYSQPRTHQVAFIPIIPAEKRQGSCFSSSLMVNQPFAWRCTTNDNILHDPCLVAGDGETVVCDANPAKFEMGFALNLTTPPFTSTIRPWATPKKIGDILTREVLENAIYFSWLVGGHVTLENGRFGGTEGYEIISVWLSDVPVYGDVNGDGVEDAIVILHSGGGGTGQFIELAVVINDKGQPKNVASTLLGDRITLKHVTIDNGVIVVNMITQRPGEGLCCATMPVTQTYLLDGDKLTLQHDPQWLMALDNYTTCHFAPQPRFSLADGQEVHYVCDDESYLTDIVTKGNVWKTDKVVITHTNQSMFTVVSSQTVNIYITWQPTDPLQVAQEIGLMPNAVTMTLGNVAKSMLGQVRPATAYGPDVPPALQDGPAPAAPAHLIFTFDEGVLAVEEGVDFTQPQLFIYPLEAYQNMYAQTDNKELEHRVSRLKTLLATRPTHISDTLPVLPDLYRPQALTAQVKYLDFKHGSGVRFITYYDDYPGHSIPATNETIFYTFQGLTQDGKYYIAYFSPITTTVLPNNYDESDAAKDREAFVAKWDSYIIKTQHALNTTTDFIPTLTSLDTMLQSLQVRP